MWRPVIVRRFSPDSRLARQSGEGAQYAKTSNTQIFAPHLLTLLILPTIMPTKAELVEEKVLLASQAIDTDPTPKKTKVITRFGAPYDRLIACRQGCPASNTRGGHNKKLFAPQDHSLKDYIVMLKNSSRATNLDAIKITAGRSFFYETRS
jgi:hypothetical protein